MSGVAMLSNIIVLIVINKFKKINSKEDKGKDKDKSEEQLLYVDIENINLYVHAYEFNEE